ncbi:PucR C-terminal helix-turn-helix domain-containing protein [Oscillibacter sp. PC13]|uniref:PucR family transcriptional regulator n=1 Tax=Oscillibacter sp. PC13 TaxID=1855299 RepID=UPI0008F1AC9B|nr:PucR family transcriptional regulator [Oscillibacter sp. PC13]SFP88476.1 PucR C-terminal helix-turn-helix domain-containing protein [Oscillibacter sp. PC13]
MNSLITVEEILKRPLYKQFRCVSGARGLGNHVFSTGFLEWETGTKIFNSFPENEFVLTTLSFAKNAPMAVEEALTNLIKCRVAAIAIKRVYLRTIPDSIKKLSDSAGVPILFFDDLYVDDLLFDLKIAILEDDPKRQEKIIDDLLAASSLPTEEREQLALRLNSRFESNLVFCAFITEEKTALPIEGSDAFGGIPQWSGEKPGLHNGFGKCATKHLLLPYRKGTLCLYTAREKMPVDTAQILAFLKPYFLKKKKYQVGIRILNDSLPSIPKAIHEAICANKICIMNQSAYVEFSQAGVDRFLCFSSETPWARIYYLDLLNRIEANMDAPGVALNTIFAFVKSGGDIDLISKKMYQHSNTIRYRLSRIKKLWEAQDDIVFKTQTLLFTKLYHLYEYES